MIRFGIRRSTDSLKMCSQVHDLVIMMTNNSSSDHNGIHHPQDFQVRVRYSPLNCVPESPAVTVEGPDGGGEKRLVRMEFGFESETEMTALHFLGEERGGDRQFQEENRGAPGFGLDAEFELSIGMGMGMAVAVSENGAGDDV